MDNKKDIFIQKADTFVHEVYEYSRAFPKEEIYGVTSQLRRAALSIVLNVIEGYARNSKREYKHFLDISYGSLKETKYLLSFCFQEKYFTEDIYTNLLASCDELAKILWSKRKAVLTNE